MSFNTTFYAITGFTSDILGDIIDQGPYTLERTDSVSDMVNPNYIPNMQNHPDPH